MLVGRGRGLEALGRGLGRGAALADFDDFTAFFPLAGEAPPHKVLHLLSPAL